ncbi:DUF488 domain-containing protein [bacterium]|nr:DUF488 domain-containing protein [bacterium]
MNIYTSYFAKMKKLGDDIVPIAICAKVPTGINCQNYKKLAPSFDILMQYKSNPDKDLYTQRYRSEILGKLDVETVISDLTNLSGGKDIALLCYEKTGDFCHRHLVADWLWEAGYTVAELVL